MNTSISWHDIESSTSSFSAPPRQASLSSSFAVSSTIPLSLSPQKGGNFSSRISVTSRSSSLSFSSSKGGNNVKLRKKKGGLMKEKKDVKSSSPRFLQSQQKKGTKGDRSNKGGKKATLPVKMKAKKTHLRVTTQRKVCSSSMVEPSSSFSSPSSISLKVGDDISHFVSLETKLKPHMPGIAAEVISLCMGEEDDTNSVMVKEVDSGRIIKVEAALCTIRSTSRRGQNKKGDCGINNVAEAKGDRSNKGGKIATLPVKMKAKKTHLRVTTQRKVCSSSMVEPSSSFSSPSSISLKVGDDISHFVSLETKLKPHMPGIAAEVISLCMGEEDDTNSVMVKEVDSGRIIKVEAALCTIRSTSRRGQNKKGDCGINNVAEAKGDRSNKGGKIATLPVRQNAKKTHLRVTAQRKVYSSSMVEPSSSISSPSSNSLKVGDDISYFVSLETKLKPHMPGISAKVISLCMGKEDDKNSVMVKEVDYGSMVKVEAALCTIRNTGKRKVRSTEKQNVQSTYRDLTTKKYNNKRLRISVQKPLISSTVKDSGINADEENGLPLMSKVSVLEHLLMIAGTRFQSPRGGEENDAKLALGQTCILFFLEKMRKIPKGGE